MKQMNIGKKSRLSIVIERSRNFERYMNEVSKFELLTPSEEAELARKAQKGCKQSLDKIVSANTRFVISIAKRMKPATIDVEDLIQEGNMGLIEAAMRFKPDKGFKLCSYAVWWIRQKMTYYIEEHRTTVRSTQKWAKNRQNITKLEEKYDGLGKSLEDEDICKLLKIPMCELEAVRKFNFKMVSADEPNLETEEPMQLVGDLESIEDVLVRKDAKNYINSLLKSLPEQFEFIVRSHFGIGTRRMTTYELARHYKCTQQSISEKRNRAMKILRKNININALN